MSNVDSGKWKFVISASTTRKLKPGVMKRRVSPSNGHSSWPLDGARLSDDACSGAAARAEDVLPACAERAEDVLPTCAERAEDVLLACAEAVLPRSRGVSHSRAALFARPDAVA